MTKPKVTAVTKYKVDVESEDGRSGDTIVVEATSAEDAVTAARADFPQFPVVSGVYAQVT